LKSEREIAVARWVYEHGHAAGHSTDTLPGSECMYLPLTGTERTRGVLAAALGRRHEPPSPAQRQLLETFVAQTALALERALLAETAAQAGLAAETERTRNTLLSAVSHDLRTPLAAIAGTAELVADPKLPEDVRREMLTTIRIESQRLARLLTNLLDLSRLESGAHVLRREICPVEETLVAALAQMKSRLAQHDVHVHSPAEDLLVAADPVLLEQAVVNLLDNAAKYSPAGTSIEIRASGTAREVTVEIADRGPGIPPGEEERIFERFYRADDGARAEGAGLGLAICRGIARALGGRVQAQNREGGGASFSITLPREQAVPALKDAEDELEAS
jgi:two-component system sensor histidine kinase KdpD